MKNYLSQIDKRLLAVIKKIGQEADRQNIPAYVVGGIVRDVLLKRKNFDLDIVIESDARPFAKKLAKILAGKITVYNQFLTATIELPSKLRIDIATTRQEHYQYSGALPTVRVGSLRDDLFRRDFTINAMAISINKNRFGHLVDEFEGLSDLRDKKIRVLHSRSFIDDPTRILRAIRFEQRLLFKMERTTLQLLKAAVKQRKDKAVKLPRYFAEFKKILSETDVVRIVKRLNQLHGMAFLGKNFKVVLRTLSLIQKNLSLAQNKSLYYAEYAWFLYFLSLMEDNPRLNSVVSERFPLTKNEKASLFALLDISVIMKTLSTSSLKPSGVYQLLKKRHEMFVAYLQVRSSQKRIWQRVHMFLSHDQYVKLKVTGGDLKRLGCSQGREMKKILDGVLLQKIDHCIRTKSEELQLAKSYLGEARRAMPVQDKEFS